MLDLLPDELLDRIFHRFPLGEIIALRRVCKKFRDVIDFQMRFRELAIFVGQSPFDETLFYSGEYIDLSRQAIRTDSLAFLREEYFKSKFKNLEKLLLFVNQNLRLQVQLDECGLNEFDALVHLEIHHVLSIDGRLKLPALRTLSVDTILKCEFELDCPSLLALNLDGEAAIAHLTQPQSVRYLECPTIPRNFDQFENLNIFVCYKLIDLNAGPLMCLPNLKEVHLYSIKKREYLDALIEARENCKRGDLKIVFGGIDVQQQELFDALCSIFEYLFSDLEIWTTNFLTSRLLRFYTRNCVQLDATLPFIEYLEIDNFEISQLIITKLVNLKTLYIFNQFIDDEKFNLLMRSCRKLKYIQFFSLVLGQAQYDQMPRFLKNLRHLEFKRRVPVENFDFVSSLENLEFFGSSQQLKMCELKRIVLACKLLKTVKCKHEDTTFFISLVNRNVRYLESTFQFDTFEQLLDHIDRSESIGDFVCKLLKLKSV